MGKKTIEDLAKLILMIIITAVINFYTAKRHLKDSKLEGKLDRTEYEKDQKEKWSNHNKLHIEENKAAELQSKQIQWLYQNEIMKNNYKIKPLEINE